jgi:hypothetical protein
LALANLAPSLAESEAESREIGVNRRVSKAFWALVPKMEAMRGGGSSFPREGRVARVQGIHVEAADGIRTHDLLHGKQTL